MKKTLLISGTAFLFLCFLGLGLWAGRRILHEPSPVPVSLDSLEDPSPSQQVSQSATTLEPAGEMVLIVLTRSEASGQTVEGVWLLSTDREENQVNFLPVLPSQAEDGRVRDQILRAAYGLNEPGQPGPDFFRVLRERNLNWDGYLVVAEDQLVELEDYLTGSNLIPGGSLESLWYDPDTAEQSRNHQADLLQSACEALQKIEFTPEDRQVMEGLLNQPGLAGTSAAGKVFVSAENSAGTLPVCLFPTLDGSSR